MEIRGSLSSSSSRGEAEGDAHDLNREKCVLFLLGLALNSAMPVYLSYINVYGAAFDKSVLGWMSICIFGSSVVVMVLQLQFDAHFDAQDATKAYTFRILVGLFSVGCILLAIPFAERVWHVYALGIICGVFEGAAISSMSQLAASIHPEMTKYTNTGLTFALAIPAVLSAALGFHDENPSFETKVLYAWLPIILPLIASIAFCMATFWYRLEGFNQALGTIQRRASTPSVSGRMLDKFERDGETRETSPLMSSQVGEDGPHSTSWSWFEADFFIGGAVQFLGHGLARAIVPFMTYLGSLTQAHLLVLNSFISELAGRIAAHVVSLERMGVIGREGIAYLVFLTIVRISLGVLLMLQAFKRFDLGEVSLHAIVSIFYFLYGWVANEVPVLVVGMGPKEERAEIVRGVTLLNFLGQLVSLCIAVPVVMVAFQPSNF